MIKSFCAGICIGLGGLVYLSVENKMVGAFLFSIGLFSVLIFKLDLYTGLVCKPIVLAEKPSLLVTSLVGNSVGAVYIGLLPSVNHVGFAHDLCINKLNKDSLEWLVMAIVCGMFIALAVYGWTECKGNYSHIMVMLGVMGFILSGAEHVVADAFYFSMARMITDPDVLIRLLMCAFGNFLGGAFIGYLLSIIKLDEWNNEM